MADYPFEVTLGKYGYEIDINAIDADAMNEKASEATEFMSFMATVTITREKQ
jgi:hypothetical protein